MREQKTDIGRKKLKRKTLKREVRGLVILGKNKIKEK